METSIQGHSNKNRANVKTATSSLPLRLNSLFQARQKKLVALPMEEHLVHPLVERILPLVAKRQVKRLCFKKLRPV
jgi:hypothetical protein